MDDLTEVGRSIHPDFYQDGDISYCAFKPFPRDEGLLSVYDGDQASQAEMFAHYTQVLHNEAVGVASFTVAEARGCGDLDVRPDPQPGFPEHAVVDFTKLTSKREMKTAAKKILEYAEKRFWKPS